MAKGTLDPRSKSPKVSVTFPPALLDEINAIADRDGTSFAKAVRQILRLGLEACK
jgi:metal-responsive CopG/Arc/MetJ family transcriptional regulator